MELLRHFDGIVPSVASILAKQHSICSGKKYLLETTGNAISETQDIPRCLNPQELVPLVRVLKLLAIHYQPAT